MDRKIGHTASVQAGEEAADTSAEAVELDPCCVLKDLSRGMGVGSGDESTQSRSVVQPLRNPPVIRPDRRTYVVVVVR